MIDIPDEFADLSATDVRPAEYFRKSRRKKILRTKTNRNLEGYDAWRNHDRRVFIHDAKHKATLKLMLSPADLWKVFGQPDMADLGAEATGEYMFEDNNLDMYYLFDYKQTDIYHGLNREDEYYQSPKNLRKPFHQRKRKWPSTSEFWESSEPALFKLIADDHADVRKFKRWLLLKLRKASVIEKSFDDKVLEKYSKDIDICLGDYSEKSKPNTDMAVFKVDWTDFMTPEEVKQQKEQLQPLTKAKYIDLNRAKRVKITREEIKL